jgi:hypothetical protein
MSKKPPMDEIAAYARAHITCRNCAAKPGFPCITQADWWRTVCNARFADGAAVYVPLWKDTKSWQLPDFCSQLEIGPAVEGPARTPAPPG